ncbi:hypothetical protein [Neptuniibacter pectenicola]|uniref:hypothetical protein n=1 Tax=Neptuniibacter pectenicola TaxID=1806669 RepID=UPI00082B43EE|nr:hypothetical protein [Neptuniibacter pectenicola]
MRIHVNNYSSTIDTTTVLDSDLTLDVDSATGLPSLAAGEYIELTITDSLSAPTKTEIIKVTAISSETLTIERAQEGTTAQGWVSGDFIECRATKNSFDQLDGTEIKRYKETVATASSAIDRADGGIQTYTMTANTTFTIAINAGESLTLHLSAGDTYTATWPAMTWVGGSAPTLTAVDAITFWKVGSDLFGAYVGSIA